MEAYTPKDVIGMIVDRMVEQNANRFVIDVAIMAAVAFLNVYDSLLTLSSLIALIYKTLKNRTYF